MGVGLNALQNTDTSAFSQERRLDTPTGVTVYDSQTLDKAPTMVPEVCFGVEFFLRLKWMIGVLPYFRCYVPLSIYIEMSM